MSIQLGDEVKDRITGFKGIVISLHEYLNACRRVGVQPRIGRDGKLEAAQSFDEPDLEVIKAGAYRPFQPVRRQKVGGPARWTPPSR